MLDLQQPAVLGPAADEELEPLRLALAILALATKDHPPADVLLDAAPGEVFECRVAALGRFALAVVDEDWLCLGRTAHLGDRLILATHGEVVPRLAAIDQVER